MSAKQLTTIHDHVPSAIIRRKAINAFGRLGSLYDACKDRLVLQGNIDLPGEESTPTRAVKCVLIPGHTDINRDILKIIDIEDDLRLSLLLNLTPSIGIAAILNDYQINERTRLLYYNRIDREERVSDQILNKFNFNSLLRNTPFSTHMITGITFGIDVLVVLQLPYENDLSNHIDHILDKISNSLSNRDDVSLGLTPEENELLNNYIQIKIYSNIRHLTGIRNISQLFQQIERLKRNPRQTLPVTYFLQPIVLPSVRNVKTNLTYRNLPAQLNHHLEQFIQEKRTIRTKLKLILHENGRQFSSEYLKGRVYGALKQYSCLQPIDSAKIKQIAEVVVRIRSGQISIDVIDEILNERDKWILQQDRNELRQKLQDLTTKGQFINDLRNNHIIYYNVIDYDVKQHDNERTIETKLIGYKEFIRMLCSKDTLNRQNNRKLNEILSHLVEERQTNPNIRVIYADFSDCLYKLHDMRILASDDQRYNQSRSEPRPPPPFIDPQRFVRSDIPTQRPLSPITEVPPPKKPVSTDDTINILLLGETGVGKSTFINAFANYLTFNSLTQAQQNDPVAIIPVSFTMTVGDNFEERTVRFGGIDKSQNEHFNDVGQSVTQHCRSYVFTLKQNGQKIRIIDTPGFGDTRGLEQDDRNMEHILQYLNNLTHLNAICFLLKPNTSRLNMFFRTCLTQLFSFLAPTARENIIFCFTNGRSTFYTPGDTAPLLKTMLKSLSIHGIRFEKENTYCFDSESFRYLVALQNNIRFSEDDRHEYEASWSTSAKESNRLLDYIHRNLIRHSMETGWQSIKHAQLQISYMIRPILETIRNILRNFILYKRNLSNVSIELVPKPTLHSIAHCLTCRYNPIQIGPFWIIPDQPHDFRNECRTCRCPSNQHQSMNYILEYQAKNSPSHYHPNEMHNRLQQLYYTSAAFSHFLIHGAHSTKDDVFMLGLLEMIRQEQDICQQKNSNEMNLDLINELEKARHQYGPRVHQIASNQDSQHLEFIYEQINIVNNYPEIQIQMNAIKQSQKELMKLNEIVI